MKYLICQIGILLSLISGTHEEWVINAGIGGNTTTDLLNRIEADVLEKHPDLVIVMVGTNDMLNSRKMLSYQDYTQNLSLITQKLKARGIEVLLISPPPVDTVFLFERHKKEAYTVPPNAKMDTLSQIIQQVAYHNSALFLDLFGTFKEMNIPMHNEDEYIKNPKNSGTRDGIHPTVKGYKLIATTVFQSLQENNVLKKGMKIVCFGDSLTFGANVKGAGTVSGDTYPAYLLSMIEDHVR